MYERGMLAPAIKLARTGLEIAEALSTETRLLRADLWTTIGGAQLPNPKLAEDSYQSLKLALDLRLSAVDAGLMERTHPQIANSHMSLGTAALGVGHVQEALDLGERSVALRQGRTDEQVQMLALSHHNVALASLTAGRVDKADREIETSMRISGFTGQSMTPEQKLYAFQGTAGVVVDTLTT